MVNTLKCSPPQLNSTPALAAISALGIERGNLPMAEIILSTSAGGWGGRAHRPHAAQQQQRVGILGELFPFFALALFRLLVF